MSFYLNPLINLFMLFIKSIFDDKGTCTNVNILYVLA